ncbi:MAG: NADPH-dependent butanol dehydrogenase, partial [Candidatus Thorarchaeota archaeon]|nr:NADPH-dependent butanol dehydrogenase [Candidatus Thorarchaeota archaeon]
MVWWFAIPKIVFGDDALLELETVKGQKALIITDKVINELGLAEKVSNLLCDNKWETAIW